jgi:hypothetical protein
MRYKLAPSLIAAGRTIQTAGFPLTARCDLIWPEYPEANDPTQYIHLNATLVAPLEGEPSDPESGPPRGLPSSRSVWIPPGEWQDGWSGATVVGPKQMEVSPTESDGVYHIPMWHKKGGLLVTVSEGALRIGDQDWSELTIEGFPASGAWTEWRDVYEQDHSEHSDDAVTTVQLRTDGGGKVYVDVSASVAARAWVVRLHLAPGQQLSLSAAAAAAGGVSSVLHIQPPAGCSAADASSPVPGEESFTPFGGVGTRPACLAGPVAEFRLEPRSGGHHIELALGVGSL